MKELPIKEILLMVILTLAFLNPDFCMADEGEELLPVEQAMGAPGTLETTILKKPEFKKIKVSKAVKLRKKKSVSKSSKNKKIKRNNFSG